MALGLQPRGPVGTAIPRPASSDYTFFYRPRPTSQPICSPARNATARAIAAEICLIVPPLYGNARVTGLMRIWVIRRNNLVEACPATTPRNRQTEMEWQMHIAVPPLTTASNCPAV